MMKYAPFFLPFFPSFFLKPRFSHYVFFTQGNRERESEEEREVERGREEIRKEKGTEEREDSNS
jgi:hypothetical protein